MVDTVPVTEWPLQFAAERFASKAARYRLREAERSIASWSRPRDAYDDDERLRLGRRSAAQELPSASDAVWEELRRLAQAGRVAVYGSRDSVFGEQIEIRADQLASVNRHIFEQAFLLFGHGSNAIGLYAVQVVPVLVSPDAGVRLKGSLDAVLAEHLWADPEIAGLSDGEGHSIFGALVAQKGDGRFLVPLTDSRVALKEALAQALSSEGEASFDEWVAQIIDILSDRLSRLFSLIITGLCRIEGRADDNDDLDLLPVDFWREAGLSLCLTSATLFRRGEVAWRDLRVAGAGGSKPVADAGGRAPHGTWVQAVDAVMARLILKEDADLNSGADLARRVGEFANNNPKDGKRIGSTKTTTSSEADQLAAGWLKRNFKNTWDAAVQIEAGSRKKSPKTR